MTERPSSDLPLPDEGSRWRCSRCGNLTRFDVTRSTRVREYIHVELSGLATVEERNVLVEQIESVRCRWCDAADTVEVVPTATSQPRPTGSAAPDDAASLTDG